VEQGLGVKNLKAQQLGRKFRNPDALGNPAEELRNLTSNLYDKVAGSRAIAPYLTLEGNLSRSFNVLLSGIKNIVEI